MNWVPWLSDDPPSSSPTYQQGTGGFAKQTYVLALGLLVLVAMGACTGEDQPAREPETPAKAESDGFRPAIDPELADKFRGLAPADWTLRRTHGAAAQFDVQLAGSSGGEPVVVRGAVLLDGRFEPSLSPMAFSPSVVAREREKFGAVPEEYPTVDGFEAVIDSRSLGFDTRRGIQVRSIKYINRDQGVFCRGTSPGLHKCFWGDPEVRLALNFHSDHTVPALEYIKENVFAE